MIHVFALLVPLIFSYIQTRPFKDLQWKHRIVVVFGDQSDSAFSNQIDELLNSKEGLEDRDLVVFTVNKDQINTSFGDVTLDVQTESAREYYNVNSDEFLVLLIGKDGSEKGRWTSEVSANTIFALIDTMPMRREEMRGR